MKRVQDKVAIVTGGASGLGKAIAERLTEEGAKVMITDVQSDLGKDAALELGCDFLEQDVTQEKQWDDIVQQVEAKYGDLHILVNNAGILGPMDCASPESTPLPDWQRIFAVNVDSTFLGCRAAIPLIRQSGGGSIINVSSIAALMASSYATAYGASKAAVRHLTKSVAQHCAETRSNIRCNSVHPGIILTPMTDSQYETIARERGVPKKQIVNEAKSFIPQGEFTKAEDIANAVLYLASDESGHVTGTKLIVDGGYINCETYSPKSLSGA